jgi:hypothetical protein
LQLGNVRRYASGFIKSHRLGNFGIALVGVAVHVSDGLLIGVYDLEAAVYGLNGPWWQEASHWQRLQESHSEQAQRQ